MSKGSDNKLGGRTHLRTTGRTIILTRLQPLIHAVLMEDVSASQEPQIILFSVIVKTNQTLGEASSAHVERGAQAQSSLTRSTQLEETFPSFSYSPS
jgi:hypothetical protein